MRPSEINVRYRGGFRGPYIDVRTLIERRIKITIIDFMIRKSNVRDCETYVYMQIRISGTLCVTWHSSSILNSYLQECRAQSEAYIEENNTDPQIFPINDCIIVEGQDGGYYLEDAPADAWELTQSDIITLSNESHKGRRWSHGR